MSPEAGSTRVERYAGPVELPTDLRQALRTEFRHAFHAPYETPIVVAMNGALMCSAWFLAPPGLLHLLFSFHGSLAFAAVLASWMYSDVPATNVLGSDARRSLAALDDPLTLQRLVTAKNLVLWVLITPLCAVLAVVIGLARHDLLAAGYAVIWIVVVPFGTLGVSAWVGIVFPYHAMPLPVRWRERKRFWPVVARWGVLVVTPYVVVPVLAALIMLPSLALWGVLGHHGSLHRLPDRDLGAGVLVACAVSAACWLGGHRVGSSLVRRRRDKLASFLADPLRG